MDTYEDYTMELAYMTEQISSKLKNIFPELDIKVGSIHDSLTINISATGIMEYDKIDTNKLILEYSNDSLVVIICSIIEKYKTRPEQISINCQIVK